MDRGRSTDASAVVGEIGGQEVHELGPERLDVSVEVQSHGAALRSRARFTCLSSPSRSSHDVGALLLRMDVVEVAVGRWLPSVLVGDSVLHRQLGADQRLAGDVHQVGVVVERPDDVAGQLGGFGGFQDVAELLGVAGDDLRTRSVSSEPIQIDTAAMPNSLKSNAMSAAILSVPAFGTP